MEGLKPVSQRANLTLSSDTDQDTQMFGCIKTPYLSMRDLCLFVCFVALRPKSTAMVIAGRSVHLTTLFPGQA